MLHIRPSVASDVEAIADVIVSIQQLEFGIAITREAQPDLADIQGFYQQNAGNFWVAEVDGKIVGTIALLDIGNGDAALRKMFVAEAYRGRVHRVSDQLLSTLLAWSAHKRLRHIYLGTTDRFLAAHRFYEKNGFREIAKGRLPTSFPIMTVDSKFYHLALPRTG